MKVRNLPYPFLRGQPLKYIETFYILHDTFAGEVVYQWSPYNSTSLQISEEKTLEYY